MSDARTHTAWLLWCISEGYTKAEDRAIEPNWLENDPTTLHPDDAELRPHLLAMADEVLAFLPGKLDDVTRFEVIDHRALTDRTVVAYDCAVDIAVQDEGRTLKVFLRGQP